MPEFKAMRRLSVYFTGGEAITLTLEPEDTFDTTHPRWIVIEGAIGGQPFVRWLNTDTIAHTYLQHYTLEVTEPPKPDPEKIEPDDELL